jgi:hypothetical protein
MTFKKKFYEIRTETESVHLNLRFVTAIDVRPTIEDGHPDGKNRRTVTVYVQGRPEALSFNGLLSTAEDLLRCWKKA